MSDSLKIGIVGAGAIGVFVGGSLQLRSRPSSARVTYVGRSESFSVFTQHDHIALSTAQDSFTGRLTAADFHYTNDMSTLSDADIVIVAVKGVETHNVAVSLSKILTSKTLVFSFQNGVDNAKLLRDACSGIAICIGASIVTFNVVWKDNSFRRTTAGPLILEHPSSSSTFIVSQASSSSSASGACLDMKEVVTKFDRFVTLLQESGLEVEVAHTHKEMLQAQYAKLTINLINAVNALSGMTSYRMLCDRKYRCVWGACMQESINVLRAVNIPPARVLGVPLVWLPRLVCLPDALFWMAFSKMAKADTTTKSSMLQDLERGRTTEIELLNGEIVRLADTLPQRAAKSSESDPVRINRQVIDLIHQCERNRASICLSSDQLVRVLGVDTSYTTTRTKFVLGVIACAAIIRWCF